MSDIEKIDACYLGFIEVVRQGDGDKCASLCDENAAFMPPGESSLKGRDVIRQFNTRIGSGSTVPGEALKTEVSAKLVYQQPRIIRDTYGKTKYPDTLDVCRQQDHGSWLSVVSAWNNAQPLDYL